MIIKKALIVDDDTEIIECIASVLTELGSDEIIQISNSMKLQENYGNDLDLLVIDLFMPELDGIEILRYLGEMKSRSFIILISGQSKQVLASAERIARAYGLNVLGTLAKPFSINSLIELVEKAENFSSRSRNMRMQGLDFTEEDLREAVHDKKIIMYYQPQIDLRKKIVSGFEALVRWQHPQHGLVFPDQFLARVEKMNLLPFLTEYIIDEALGFCGQLKQEGYYKRISVNVTVFDLIDSSMPEYILSLIKKYSLDTEQVVIELIETGQIEENLKSLEILTRLSMKGINLSIDDFGTGYSSLNQLQKAPFNELKIDKSFVFEFVKNPDSRTIIESTVDMAHKLNLEVVAEGIENRQIADMLTDIGVDTGQGYHFSMPLPAFSVTGFIRSYIYR
ncbi:MAG TPA: EAL domain-containing response regulator [Leptospiraceae bacterium]|nr:EAL domain-containing response regulator [Leptospiraceae bacterium]